MKVKDLQAVLSRFDPELEVFGYTESSDSTTTYEIDEVTQEPARKVSLGGGGMGLKFEAAGSPVVVISLSSDF